MAFLKVQRLVTSDLSTLAGEFVQSPTAILRALQAWERVTDDETQGKDLPRSKAEIAKCLAPMFSLPFFHSETAHLETQVVYTTRFAIEFLQKIGMLGPTGFCRSLANLVTHLFEIEPANLMLAQLLVSGALHKYLEDESKKVRKGDRRTHLTVKLVSVLGWLFFQRRLPASIPKDRAVRKKHLPSEGCPLLPALPKSIQEEMKKYNRLVLEHFQQLAWTVTTNVGKIENTADVDLVLPLSGRKFSPTWLETGNPFEKDSAFAKTFIDQILRYRARSPFSAIAGVGDTFASSSDLAKSVRNVMHLDLNQLPTVANDCFMPDELEATNSWVLDFMIHGKIKYLLEDNGINQTAAWKLISEFKESVKRTTVAIKNYSPNDDIVLKTFEQLGEEMERYLRSGS